MGRDMQLLDGNLLAMPVMLFVQGLGSGVLDGRTVGRHGGGVPNGRRSSLGRNQPQGRGDQGNNFFHDFSDKSRLRLRRR